jgi:integrase
MKIKDITENDMQSMLDRCDKGYATKTNMRQVMQGVMEYAVTKGIRGDDPSALLNAGKQKTSDAHKAFKEGHLELLLDTVGAEAIVFLAYTGMRVTELLELEVANISIEERYMVGGIKTDEGKKRKIPIHRSQIPFLKKQMKDKKKYLFEYKGKKMKYLYFREHYWDNILAELKMEYTPHDARHTFVTNMRKAGVDLLVVQKIVGHIPKSTTEKVYTHIGLDEIIAAIEMLP